ncbi:nicotinate-nucleotide pyrophosphorylase [carboxylating] [Nitrosomonas aestuarii]|uniref:Probable nicotinate-nucleotide pyrophosphorylase [carboxylating] n=1 Tax=Nitrosomonas aestuarii TaxID=52441 RepID=A0A1I3ZRV0_9PROT|nr:carboxylating nicotinate-nucleotide diphosphorylase [Nitrosomonas aestuarii]SFK46677.1 nicotinate-nucleotide pyrophosphorylase [carboxylating] [Nitrosomonas aestuarii]
MLDEIENNVRIALREDIGTGDLTALLIPEQQTLTANVMSRETAVLSGVQWFELCFKTLAPDIQMRWHARDGDTIAAQQTLCEITGQARTLLTAERSALNFLQMLSAVATQTRRYVDAIVGTDAMIVDTRKTLPGLRLAQKYAVQCGGGVNHRIGLYDGILIKENHIAAGGGIAQTLKQAQTIAPEGVFIQIEVESITQLHMVLNAGATMILLDNFAVDQLNEAVAITKKHSQMLGRKIILEASGNIGLENVRRIAETGVDRISIGGLTKNIRAVDLSMRFV